MKDETISTRFTDHVELIFLPISLIFWLWNDVRALLWLQAAALALGAWPIYLLARRWLRRALCSSTGAADVGGRLADLAAWGGLIFALAYLLSPALQAAAVSEFHALPLAAPLIAWAFWTVEQRQWGRFVLAAFLLANVQEGMALLTALLGLYAAFGTLARLRRRARPSHSRRHRRTRHLPLRGRLVLPDHLRHHSLFRTGGLWTGRDALRRPLRGAGRFLRRCRAQRSSRSRGRSSASRSNLCAHVHLRPACPGCSPRVARA